VHELGARVRVRLEEADVTTHTIRFARVPRERIDRSAQVR
jgi:hypothetical protein